MVRNAASKQTCKLLTDILQSSARSGTMVTESKSVPYLPRTKRANATLSYCCCCMNTARERAGSATSRQNQTRSCSNGVNERADDCCLPVRQSIKTKHMVAKRCGLPYSDSGALCVLPDECGLAHRSPPSWYRPGPWFVRRNLKG